MAAEALLAGRLPLGTSRAESERLLQQTHEAAAAGLAVAGVFDLRPALAAAASGGVLNARQLEGVAGSLESAFALRRACMAPAGAAPAGEGLGVHGGGGSSSSSSSGGSGGVQRPAHPSLAALAAGIQQQEMATLGAIRSCIRDGTVLSEASEDLSLIREARRANKDEARARITAIARELHARGAAEGREPLLMRGRYCVAVRSNQRGALPKGNVKLGASGTGATLYLEPAELLELNNAEALMAEQEDEAELAVLQLLSQLLAQRGGALQGILDAVTALDIVAARAKHAAWLDGVRPAFISGSSTGSSSSSSSSSSGSPSTASPLHLPGARHPLLLAASRLPLPRPPSVDDAAFEADFVPPPPWASSSPSSGGGGGSGSSSDDEQPPSAPAGLAGPGPRAPPQPLALRVPAAGVRVVAITGPNTGGKTVTLKTAGLLALMAKAGMFLPVERAALSEAAGSGAAPGAAEQPTLLWFDQVLADIGDAQSLQQNLSTFSGHIQRLKLLLAAAGPDSLVLLDEVGSGTDPQEGAALARAVLDRLAGQARLTLATSHHAELKSAADEDSRYVNVSMEFNTVSLRPTYRLCWGSAGSSNALDIAQALGFDSRVLADARILARANEAASSRNHDKMAQVAASVEAQLAAARASLAELHAGRQAAERDAEALRDRYRELLAFRSTLKSRATLVARESAEMVLQVQQAASAVRRGEAQVEDVSEVISRFTALVGEDRAGPQASPGVAVGDRVVVPSLGVAMAFTAEVTKVHGDEVWLKSDLQLISPSRGQGKSRALKMKLHQVVPLSELDTSGLSAGLSWQGLRGVEAGSADDEARLLSDVQQLLGERQAAAGSSPAGS